MVLNTLSSVLEQYGKKRAVNMAYTNSRKIWYKKNTSYIACTILLLHRKQDGTYIMYSIVTTHACSKSH